MIVLVFVNSVSQCHGTTVVFAFHGIFHHATGYLDRQLGRKMLRKSFQQGLQQNTLRIFGNILRSRHNLYSIFPQLSFVVSCIVPVARKTVQLPYDDNLKFLLCAIFDHPLKFRPIVGLCRQRPVNVCPYDLNTMPVSKFFIFPDLRINRFLPLRIRGIPGIYDSSHRTTPHLILSCTYRSRQMAILQQKPVHVATIHPKEQTFFLYYTTTSHFHKEFFYRLS